MQARIESDLKAAMKSGDKKRVGTLRLVLSALKNEKIHAQRELTGEEAEAILRRGVKQRKESIDMYEKGGRSDLAASEKEELAILESYLPQAMPDSELEDTLKAIIAEKGFTSGKDAGLLMKELMARHRGRVDGKRAQETARKLLP
ncbi:MAG TPA: GatB/YqeY domain-containing protein [Thermoanaerobaculia bacterium]|nr:GatB/YqeY domain-containing protein [Thermoanaerobaculia bacterium]